MVSVIRLYPDNNVSFCPEPQGLIIDCIYSTYGALCIIRYILEKDRAEKIGFVLKHQYNLPVCSQPENLLPFIVH